MRAGCARLSAAYSSERSGAGFYMDAQLVEILQGEGMHAEPALAIVFQEGTAFEKYLDVGVGSHRNMEIALLLGGNTGEQIKKGLRVLFLLMRVADAQADI